MKKFQPILPEIFQRVFVLPHSVFNPGMALLLYLLIPLVGFTQQNQEDIILLNQLSREEKVPLFHNQSSLSVLSITQEGIENQVTVRQISWANTAAFQSGVANMISLQQAGFPNQVSVTQLGIRNDYQGLLFGDDLEGLIHQQGAYNRIDHRIAGDEIIFKIFQDGSHNAVELHVEGEGQSTLPLKIEQRGSDMQIIIQVKN